MECFTPRYLGIGGTGGAEDGGEKNPLAVTPIASTAEPEPFLEVPRPMEIEAFLAVPNGPPFSILIVDRARPETKPFPPPP